jgi:lipid-A-disaccharide synthase-like uncharacterized protein
VSWIADPWQLLGWLGIACFFSRFLVQWLASERAGESIAPRVFWFLSIAGALLLIVYSLKRGEPIFLAGYVVTLFIYLRNVWISDPVTHSRTLGPVPLMLLALVAWGVLVATSVDELRPGWGDSLVWLAVGAVGQAVWSSRFVVQWYMTERSGHSHFPQAFWWISLLGNGLLLAYAVRVGDPVWVVGLLAGPLVQIRNLMLIHRGSRSAGGGSGATPAGNL